MWLYRMPENLELITQIPNNFAILIKYHDKQTLTYKISKTYRKRLFWNVIKKTYDLQLDLYNKRKQKIRKQQRLILLNVEIKNLHNKAEIIFLKIAHFMIMPGKIKEGWIFC